MGTGPSKKEATKSPTKSKPMPYKRQFSSDAARQNQTTMYHTYRSTSNADKQSLKSDPPLKTLQELNEDKPSYDSNANLPSDPPIKKPDVLDPTKYKPPPSPAITNTAIPTQDIDNASAARKDSIKEEDEELSDSMTDAQAAQIKKNTERGLSPGVNLLAIDHDDDDEKKEPLLNMDILLPKPDDLIKQTSNHDRISTGSTPTPSSGVNDDISCSPLQWGYCEMSRKRLDEDQAAFLTWTHPTDGFVHSWAVFDGHGGYETALYSAEHFLKYVQKYHLTRKGMDLSLWKSLLNEIFIKFDSHVGSLNIRGGSTVVVVLLIGKYIICANAGDARAIMSCNNGKAVELSFDHAPMDDYDRLFKIARNKDNYKKIGKFFRLNEKNETYSDIQKLSSSEMKKAPFISREQDKSRLLGTIGVARGFGDFSLTVFGFRSIKLKPYLSAEPYVVIKELKEEEILDTDIMCIACDGVFDVMSNQEVIDTLRKEIFYRELMDNKGNEDNKALYSDEANLDIDCDRIDRACGFLGLKSYAKGTMDDVTIFTVTLKHIFEFYKQNKQ